MELKLTYKLRTNEGFCGVFVEQSDMNLWMNAAKYFKRSSNLKIFAIPGLAANTVCGALILGELDGAKIPDNLTTVYSIGDFLFLTENTSTSPKLDAVSVQVRFKTPHFYHPTFGLMELHQINDWSAYVKLKPKEIAVEKPHLGIEIIDNIRNYYIREVNPEDVIENLIKSSVPERSKAPDKPLTSFEKVKLKALKRLLKNHKKDGDSINADGGNGGDGASSAPVSMKKKSWWSRKKDELQEQYEDLEERNKRELDKLMDMLNKDPDLALKYAIPIDRSGAPRGSEGAFSMQQRWSGGRSLARNTGSGGYVNFKDDQRDLLRTKYQHMALIYERDENWEKSAFVHLELLSDPRSAAMVLEKGKLYEAAAAIHLSKLNDKSSAARCYESGKLYRKAIDLYEELNQQEKVGDLYSTMGQNDEAKVAYMKELASQKNAYNFLAAARISNEKLNDLPEARTLWRKGWDTSRTADECLENLLDSYATKQRKKEVLKLHDEKYEGRRVRSFLDVLFKQAKKDKKLEPELEKVVYESVARNASQDPNIADYIKQHSKNPLVTKDVFRFKRFGK